MSGQFMMLSNLVTTYMLVAAVTIVHAHVLPDVYPDTSSTGLKTAESTLLAILYGLLDLTIHFPGHPLHCRYPSPRGWALLLHQMLVTGCAGLLDLILV